MTTAAILFGSVALGVALGLAGVYVTLTRLGDHTEGL